MRSIVSKSLGPTTVMQIVLVLVSGAGGGSEVTGRSGVGSGGRVDLTFFRASLVSKFSDTRIFGRCLAIRSAVRPGHVETFPLLISVIKVLGTGKKAAQ